MQRRSAPESLLSSDIFLQVQAHMACSDSCFLSPSSMLSSSMRMSARTVSYELGPAKK